MNTLPHLDHLYSELSVHFGVTFKRIWLIWTENILSSVPRHMGLDISGMHGCGTCNQQMGEESGQEFRKMDLMGKPRSIPVQTRGYPRSPLCNDSWPGTVQKGTSLKSHRVAMRGSVRHLEIRWLANSIPCAMSFISFIRYSYVGTTSRKRIHVLSF